VHDLLSDRDPALEHVAESARRLRLLEEGEQHADVSQRLLRVRVGAGAHRQGDAPRGAEEVP
jgi:hypothetical protein